MEIRIPPLSESVSTATLMAWRKKEGDFVERDEVLIEVETDKVIFEIPAPAAGRLTRIVKPEGAAVISDDVIAEIDTAAAQPPPNRRPRPQPRPLRRPQPQRRNRPLSRP